MPLVVSELFTNEVRHAGGLTGFRLKAGPGKIAVTVHDAGTVPPRRLPLEVIRPGGFGRHLVQELFVDVRVDVHSTGKTVTTVVPCPTGVSPRD
ncbi:ATP-binding protein [Streptomyces sp. ME02-8801-2C]|uniref:ATP-binding protein n=1 Tax=Streptomyces sp. ME02-8801-2C TaxID=3028680 RepID=UPI0029B60630|nr:ATP-binding protein [Streptomyces sp. ME02-8801-2C]MDX3451690.1 ATP-binding protein [Streptomyces sp. ME02-8801-2C]